MQGEHIADRRNGQRDERRHGQTHFALGAELGRDGMTAGLSFRSRHDDTLQRRGKFNRLLFFRVSD